MTPKLIGFNYALYLRLVLLAIIIGLPTWQWNRDAAHTWSTELRALKLEKSRLVKSIGILQDNSSVVKAIQTNPGSIESLTLSLLESVKTVAQRDELILNQLKVEHPEAFEQAVDAVVLSVQFSVAMHRAMNLLSVFDAVREVAAWRLSEVRGCEITRSDATEHGLYAICRIDVYCYPEIDQ